MAEERKTSTIIDPTVFQAILLDSIDQKLKENNKTQIKNISLLESLINLQSNKPSSSLNIDSLNSNIDSLNSNIVNLNTKLYKLITTIEKNHNTQTEILNELKAEADTGEVLRLYGTATTTAFTIVNTITDPGHPIKAFEFTNDGTNSIYVGFNVVPSGEGADIIDVTNNLSRFDLIVGGEDLIYKYNRNKIRNIYLLSQTGTSTYRIKLTW